MSDAAPARRKGLLFYVLLCACLGIWSYVLYQVAQGVTSTYVSPVVEFPAMPSPVEPEQLVRPGPNTTYRGDFDDPFTLPAVLLAPPPGPSTRRERPPPPPPPPLTVTGIVGDTALLYDEAGASYVVRAGEQIGDARLLHVRPDHVVVRSAGRSFTLNLRQ